MGKKLSQFWYFIGAFVVANVTSFVYHMNSAIAVPVGYIGGWDRACNSSGYMRSSFVCTPSNPKFPYLAGAPCGSDWRSLCPVTPGVGGWSCTGYIYSNYQTGSCICSSATRSTYSPRYAASDGYGTTWYCNNASDIPSGVVCNSDAYATEVGGIQKRYVCSRCPSYVYAADESGTMHIMATYMATAAAGCYVVGEIQDETGLFEYTDDNRCYYAS